MQLLRVVNGAPEPYTTSRLRQDNPNVSFPASYPAALLAEYDVFQYVTDDPPAYDQVLEQIVPGNFYEDAGTWRRGWTIEPSPVPEYVTKVGLKRACEQQADWDGAGNNLWQVAKAAIATLSDSEQDEWNLATQVPRENSAFVALATSPAIGATEQQIDDVFRLGKFLE